MTNNHPSNPVTFKDTGLAPEILYSTVINMHMRPDGGAKSAKGGKRKYDRNRIGRSHANPSKYRANGGERRHAERVARNLRRQAMLKSRGAARRIDDRRLDRRLLRAAEDLLERLG